MGCAGNNAVTLGQSGNATPLKSNAWSDHPNTHFHKCHTLSSSSKQQHYYTRDRLWNWLASLDQYYSLTIWKSHYQHQQTCSTVTGLAHKPISGWLALNVCIFHYSRTLCQRVLMEREKKCVSMFHPALAAKVATKALFCCAIWNGLWQ